MPRLLILKLLGLVNNVIIDDAPTKYNTVIKIKLKIKLNKINDQYWCLLAVSFGVNMVL